MYLSYYIAKQTWSKLQARAKKRVNGPGHLVGQKISGREKELPRAKVRPIFGAGSVG
jgi:hypothetical protein